MTSLEGPKVPDCHEGAVSMIVASQSRNEAMRAAASCSVRPPVTLKAAGGWYAHIKAVCDFAATVVLFIVTAPILILAIALIKLTSRGPVLYTQTRLGRLGAPFTIFKLRTMVHECESLTGAQWSKPGDSRITGLGRWLRKTHLDELPQLWNVLRGDMSLVGPRPERPEFVPQLSNAIPRYQERMLVRPGVTGLAQVQLSADTDLASVVRKLAFDLYYVQSIGVWLDIRIAWATAFKMLGIPFSVLRTVFAFPSLAKVEGDYNRAPDLSWTSEEAP